jgi:hypothetical protein
MNDTDYLLDRIAFLEDRLSHIESMLNLKNNQTDGHLMETYKALQPADWYVSTSTSTVYDTADKDYLCEDMS